MLIEVSRPGLRSLVVGRLSQRVHGANGHAPTIPQVKEQQLFRDSDDTEIMRIGVDNAVLECLDKAARQCETKIRDPTLLVIGGVTRDA
jgi:hypothetical protein